MVWSLLHNDDLMKKETLIEDPGILTGMFIQWRAPLCCHFHTGELHKTAVQKFYCYQWDFHSHWYFLQ